MRALQLWVVPARSRALLMLLCAKPIWCAVEEKTIFQPTSSKFFKFHQNSHQYSHQNVDQISFQISKPFLNCLRKSKFCSLRRRAYGRKILFFWIDFFSKFCDRRFAWRVYRAGRGERLVRVEEKFRKNISIFFENLGSLGECIALGEGNAACT